MKFSMKRTWLWICLLLSIFIILSFIINLQQPKDYASYVSDSPAPDGVKALYTYLGEQGEVGRWSYEPEHLSNRQSDQLLMMIEPAFIPNTEQMEAYERFMEAGNTIILWRNNPHALFDIHTVPITAEALDDSNNEVVNEDDTPFQVSIESTVRIRPEEEDHVLISDDYGAIAVSRSYGQGQLITTITPQLLTNEHILIEENIAFLFTLIDDVDSGTVWFDEYTHHSQQASTFLSVYPKAFLVWMLQGIILTLLWLWYRGKRFGPIVIAREDVVRFSNERLAAVAAWYLRGKRYREALHIQSDYIRIMLQERWGLSYTKDWKELVNSLERKWKHRTKPDIDSFVTELSRVLQKEKLSKQEFMMWTKRLDQLRKEVEEG